MMRDTRMLPVLLVCLLYCAGKSLSAPGRSADEVLIGEVDIALRGDTDDAGSPRAHTEATSSQPFASKCIVDGKAYSHSQMIPSQDQSSHCLCVAGEVYCWWQTFGISSAKAGSSSALDNNEILVPASKPLEPDVAVAEDEDEDEEDEEDDEEEEEDYSAEGSSELPPEASGENAADEQLDDNSISSDDRSDTTEEDDQDEDDTNDEDEDDEEDQEVRESNDVPQQPATTNFTTTASTTSTATTTSTSTTTVARTTKAKPTIPPATCLFMGRTYRPGEPLPHSTGNCVECRCGIDGHIECSPRDCVGLRPQRPGGGDIELFDGSISNF